MLLEAKNVFFRYDKKGRWILENISFTMDNTQRIGIIADRKSTRLNSSH